MGPGPRDLGTVRTSTRCCDAAASIDPSTGRATIADQRPSWRRTVVAVLLAAVVAGGCGFGSPEPEPEAARELADRSFSSTSVVSNGDPRELLDGPLRVGFRFPPAGYQALELERPEEGATVLLTWSSGCNGFGMLVDVSRVDLEESEASEGADESLMDCGPAMGEQESWLRAFFADTTRWDLQDGELVLSNDRGRIVLEERDADDA